MKILLIHYSRFGHTKAVADAISGALATAGAVNNLHVQQVKESDLFQAKLVVMGSPTHNMNLPKDLRPILQSWPRRVLRDTWVAAFDTSYKMNAVLARFTAAPKLDRKLRKLGGKRIVAPATFYVEEREGPLYEGELERAQEWGEMIEQALASKITQIPQTEVTR